MTTHTELPRITVFALGGTIAATNKPESRASEGVMPQLGASELVAAVPELNGLCEIEAVAFRQVPSGDLSLADLTSLADEIEQRFNAGIDGVIVTQGTDTIEETAFALELLVRSNRPVVVTGAMRNPTLSGADGPANLLAAVRVALSRDAAGLGTLVVMNDEIHAARFARKTHTSSPATIRSPSVGPLGWVVEGRARIVLRTSTLTAVPRGGAAAIPAVALLTAALGDDARLLTILETLGYVGLVLEGFGGGHVPAAVMPALADVASRMPVVLASRTGSGEMLRNTYGFVGSERDMLHRGLISAGFLDGLKARILLSLLLAAGLDHNEVRDAFKEFNDSVSTFDC